MKNLFHNPMFYADVALCGIIVLVIAAVSHTSIPQLGREVWATVASITGEGGVGQVAAFSGTNTIKNANMYDVGGLIGIGQSNPGAGLDVNGNTILSGNVYAPNAKDIIIRARINFPFNGITAGATCPSTPTDWVSWHKCTAAFDERCVYMFNYVGGVGLDVDSTGMDGFCFRKNAGPRQEIIL